MSAGHTQFRELPRATQQEVERLARQNKLHPDRAVAASALEWANQIRSRPARRAGVSALAFALETVVSVLVGAVAGGISGQRLAERLLARKLTHLDRG